MKIDRHLNQYHGKLSAAQVASGMNHSLANAKRLISDAELLLANNRYPSALGLAILAIEEYGKVPILRSLTTAKTDEDIEYWWKAYRTHTKKNLALMFPEMVASGAKHFEDFISMFSQREFPRVIDNLKQISFYTDCLGKVHWSVPTEVINEELVKAVVNYSKHYVWKIVEVTEMEIQLWVKHIGPVLSADLPTMKSALEDFCMELKNAGLLKEDIKINYELLHKEIYWKH